MKKVDWYFDIVSPFAYLASQRLASLPDRVSLNPVPVLFAGLLDHWHTKGPAEIPPMRRFTFRHIAWLARRDGIPLRYPPCHPFNPLRLLRLAVLLDDVFAVQRLFRFVWAEGYSADDAAAWTALTGELGIADAESRIAEPEVKQRLRTNTEAAIALGVFGVPTFVVDGQLFWGYDAMPFLVDYLDDPATLGNEVLEPADALPEGPGRRNVGG